MTCSTCKTSAAPYELRDGKCHSCTHAELIYEREQRSNLANMAEYEMLRLKLSCCMWQENDDGCYGTGCNNAFELTWGTPKANSFRFCPFCGKTINTE